MQINSTKNLSTLYGSGQVEKPQQQKAAEQTQPPGSTLKTDTISISAEALRKQTATNKLETAKTRDTERTQQLQAQAAPAQAPKNKAAQRIDLMA